METFPDCHPYILTTRSQAAWVDVDQVPKDTVVSDSSPMCQNSSLCFTLRARSWVQRVESKNVFINLFEKKKVRNASRCSEEWEKSGNSNRFCGCFFGLKLKTLLKGCSDPWPFSWIANCRLHPLVTRLFFSLRSTTSLPFVYMEYLKICCVNELCVCVRSDQHHQWAKGVCFVLFFSWGLRNLPVHSSWSQFGPSPFSSSATRISLIPETSVTGRRVWVKVKRCTAPAAHTQTLPRSALTLPTVLEEMFPEMKRERELWSCSLIWLSYLQHNKDRAVKRWRVKTSIQLDIVWSTTARVGLRTGSHLSLTRTPINTEMQESRQKNVIILPLNCSVFPFQPNRLCPLIPHCLFRVTGPKCLCFFFLLWIGSLETSSCSTAPLVVTIVTKAHYSS